MSEYVLVAGFVHWFSLMLQLNSIALMEMNICLIIWVVESTEACSSCNTPNRWNMYQAYQWTLVTELIDIFERKGPDIIK